MDAVRQLVLFVVIATLLGTIGILPIYAVCQLQGDPDQPTMALQAIMSGLARPVKLVDTGADFIVAEQGGTIRRYHKASRTVSSTLVADLSDRVSARSSGEETGLLGLALHPEFAINHRLYVNYTTKPPLRSRVSEFRYDPATQRLDLGSEQVLLEVAQPYSNHNGGELAFGPDAMLYISFGDGGGANDRDRHSQNLNSLLGKILRIDINQGPRYQIPADNPFVNQPGKRGEIFAYGLRNVWRFSFDKQSGSLWAGDVGQDAWEEIDVIRSGENYGWPILEADRCNNSVDCNRSGLTPPVHRYDRSGGYSITGGFVYRGSNHPILKGRYIYADYISGHIWSLAQPGTSEQKVHKLISTQRNISSLAEDVAGELYVLDHSGSIFQLVEAAPPATAVHFPRRLSQTGCFTDLNKMQPAPGVVPYDVNAPLWSDGTAKSRFVVLPQQQHIGTAASRWSYPEQTIFIKNFFLPQHDGSLKAIETRFMQKYQGTWRGFSYRWNGNDAYLLDEGYQELLTIADPQHGPQEFTYSYPTRGDCLRCHNQGADYVLGFTLPQLQRAVVGPDNHDVSQLVLLNSLNVFKPALPTASPAKPLVNYRDESQPLEQRARAMLHANCSHCHNGTSAQGQVQIDLRFNTTLAAMKICNAVPQRGQFGLPQSRIVRPGAPQQSILHYRLQAETPVVRMPPLAVTRHDRDGMQVVKDWITQLNSCDAISPN